MFHRRFIRRHRAVWLGAAAVLPAAVLGAFISAPVPSGAASNNPPYAPRLLSPSEGQVLPRNGGQVFTVNDVDPDGDAYRATITIRAVPGGAAVTTFDTTPAPSGFNAVGSPSPALMAGSYTWSAHGTDVFGLSGPESTSQGFSVTDPAALGAGVATGSLTYNGSGIATGTCGPISFGYSATSALVVVDAAIAGYAGPMAMSGTGSSSCEDPVIGQGALAMSGVGGPTANGSTISCPLTGTYVRVASVLVSTVGGRCVINGLTTAPLAFSVAGAVVPTDPGAGVVAPVQHAVLDLAVSVTPG